MTNSNLTINTLENALRTHSGSNNSMQGSILPAPSGNSASAAVAVLFNVQNEEPCVLMIKRALTLTHHSGEWAFPGGMIDEADESPMHAALRETNEELGIGSRDIDLWCGMAMVDTSTGFEVWPYAGRVSDDATLTPQESEVAEVVSVPVRVVVASASKRSITLVRNGSVRNINAYAYGDRIIWGASARIIANTLDIVEKAA